MAANREPFFIAYLNEEQWANDQSIQHDNGIL